MASEDTGATVADTGATGATEDTAVTPESVVRAFLTAFGEAQGEALDAAVRSLLASDATLRIGPDTAGPLAGTTSGPDDVIAVLTMVQAGLTVDAEAIEFAPADAEKPEEVKVKLTAKLSGPAGSAVPRTGESHDELAFTVDTDHADEDLQGIYVLEVTVGDPALFAAVFPAAPKAATEPAGG